MQDLIDSTQAEPQSSQTAETDPYGPALADIENQLHSLDAVFLELDKLKAEEQELVAAYDEASREEKAVLESVENTSEKDSVKRLIECRARKDVRNAKLDGTHRRITQHVDLIVANLGPELRRSFAHLGHRLLVDKEAEISAMLDELIAPNSVAGLSNATLVRASVPVTKYRQVSNWVSDQPNPDRPRELEQLRELPPKWIASLRALIEGRDPWQRTEQ
jgi:hypothetical protein